MNIPELRKLLEAEGIQPSSYVLDDGTPDHGGSYFLRKEFFSWIVEWVERGKYERLGKFKTESEACEFLYQSIIEARALHKK